MSPGPTTDMVASRFRGVQPPGKIFFAIFFSTPPFTTIYLTKGHDCQNSLDLNNFAPLASLARNGCSIPLPPGRCGQDARAPAGDPGGFPPTGVVCEGQPALPPESHPCKSVVKRLLDPVCVYWRSFVAKNP